MKCNVHHEHLYFQELTDIIIFIAVTGEVFLPNLALDVYRVSIPSLISVMID